jgi:MoaA/NifB/PqqE/SkfB family radical SAM enzyme
VAFAGGEPTVHEQLPAWIRSARELEFETVVVQTNGRRLAVADYARDLADAGLTHLDVSLQGHTGALHDYHTRSPGSFRETAKALLNLRDINISVGVNTVATRSNFRHLDGIVAMAQRVGAVAWHLCPAQSFGSAADDFQRIVPNLVMIMPFVKRALDGCKEAGIEPFVSALPLCVLGERAHVNAVALSQAAKDHRVYAAACEPCPVRSRCAGVSAAYAEHFGGSELDPSHLNDRAPVQGNETHFPFVGIGELLAN